MIENVEQARGRTPEGMAKLKPSFLACGSPPSRVDIDIPNSNT